MLAAPKGHPRANTPNGAPDLSRDSEEKQHEKDVKIVWVGPYWANYFVLTMFSSWFTIVSCQGDSSKCGAPSGIPLKHLAMLAVSG